MSTEFITDVVDIPELIGYVRETVDGDLPFGGLLPSVTTDDIEYELTQLDLTGTGEVARYRSWDTAPPIGKRPGFSVIQGEIPPLGWSYRLNEKDIVRFNRLRARVQEVGDARLADVIFGDAERAAKAVQNRVTLAQGEILTTGAVTLTELGDTVSGNALKATFAVPGGHFVTAGVLWSDTTNAVPITNLLAWESTYRTNNQGLNPTGWLISSEVAGNLALNAQIKNFATGTSGVTPGVITLATAQQVLSAAGVRAPLIVQDVERPSLSSSTPSRVINARKVVGVGNGLGSTLYGMTPNAANLAGNGTIEFSAAPGIIAFVERSIRPAQVMTTAEGVALPVLRDPNKLFVATV